MIEPISIFSANPQKDPVKAKETVSFPQTNVQSKAAGCAGLLMEFGRKLIAKRESVVEKKWLDLGLPAKIIEEDLQFVQFLVSSRLIYSLIGFSRSADNNPHFLGIDFDRKTLKVQNQWISWEEAKTLFTQHSSSPNIIVSKNDHSQVWTCISPDGLVPKDRLHYSHAYPVHILSERQYQSAKAQAMKFLENCSEQDRNTRNSILQFVTSHKKGQNERFSPQHCGIRLIVPENGVYRVYSFGMEMTEEELKLTRPYRFFFSPFLFKTVLTKIGMCDFEEFQAKEFSRITSIPLIDSCVKDILEMVDKLNIEDIRFNYLQQNCLSLAQEVLQLTGYSPPDTRISFGQLFGNALPLRNATIGTLLYTIKDFALKVFNRPPIRYLLKPLAAGWKVIASTWNKISTIFTNCFIATSGGLLMSTPLPKDALEQTFGQNKGIISFSRLIRSFSSLADPNVSIIHHSWPFIQWQLKQPSTFIAYHDRNRPQMHFSPSSET